MSDHTPEERIAIVVWHLAHGDSFRTSDVSAMTGLTRQGAYRLMCKVSRVVPIFQDEKGLWQVLFAQEATSVVD